MIKFQTASAAQRQKNLSFVKNVIIYFIKNIFLSKLQKWYTKLLVFVYAKRLNSHLIKYIWRSSKNNIFYKFV